MGYISSSVTLTQQDRDLNAARIGYESLTGTVTATDEAVGYPVSATTNSLTYSFWKPITLPSYWEIDFGAVRDVDYIGIAAHSLGSNSCTLQAQYWNGSSWVTIQSIAPAKDAPIMMLFDEVMTSKIRFGIMSGTAPLVGVVYVGKALVMERALYGGHSPLALSRVTTYRNNKSERGQWLGRSIQREGSSTTFAWDNLTAEWYRQYFDPFVKAARTNPFFIAWRPFTYTNEVGYVWTKSDIVPSNKGIRNLMSVSVSVEGLSID